MEVDVNSLPEKIQRIVKKWLGRKVLIVGDHPHADDVGFVDRFERVATGSYGFIVKPTNCSHGGDEFFVFHQKHCKLI